MDATWPAAAIHHCGPWLIREGRGGGKRVSAATTKLDVNDADIDSAEDFHRGLGQVPLFMLRPDQAALDLALEQRGYKIVDPVELRLAPVSGFTPPVHMTTFPHWPPLSITKEIWRETGIGAERQAVMGRVEGPRCAILSRAQDRATGAAFVASHGLVAMIHAVEVLPRFRRQGSANNILRAAARWAQANGAEWLGLAVTQANDSARALYASANMQVVGQYHYRSA
jgi:GNAT superfamily N-acetyltransferase